ncbi:hypothetical protein [Saccharothrix sp. NRRL B-16348]|uniref:hypothetical protein n=1 Tax=Saccharothrix sp. NRRL B-16348 TaxID=1415542 RepID=UPI000A3FCFF5|nr:hypothetical protein [Saccharothrix sp. NRRL B-16348]
MTNGPDPHRDFVIEDESYQEGAGRRPEGAGYATEDQGTDYPIGEHRKTAGGTAGYTDEPTADTLESVAAPLRVRFGTQGGGR